MLEGNSGAEYLEKLRYAELVTVRNYFQPGSRVVELGGGNGFQASVLGAWGCEVESYDVTRHEQGAQAFAHVATYDGKSLPVPDGSADVVFSWNVRLPRATPTFYTGYEVLPGLSVHARKRLAKLLGSSCTVFVMRPACH